jgi:uncharacterized membrane protein
MSDWYYAVNDEQKGPINESELKANLAANKLPADSLVWKDGMGDWTPANQVPAFSFRPPPSPAKVQPPATTAAPAATAAGTKVVAANPAINNPDSTKPVDLKSLIGTPEALEVDAEDAENNKVMGILAYIIFFVPLIAAKDSPFAKYHANQGLALAITMIGSLTILAILGLLIPYIYYLNILVYLGFVGLAIYGIINAAAGKCVPLPVIGGIKLIK